MRAIDTNVLVRLITRDHSEQTAAADEYIQYGAWISDLVLAEATWVFRSVYALKPHEIATAIEMLLNHESLTIQDSDAVSAALAVFRKKPALDFSDCLILEIARKSGHLPLGTFDRTFAKVDGAEKL